MLAHHVGDPRGFGFEMKALDAQGRKFRQIETRQDVEHHQHGDAGAVRRALPDVEALVQGADRRGGFGGMGGEIVQRVQAADAAQGFHHVLGDRPLIEGVASILRDRPQGLAKLRLMDHVACDRGLAMWQQIALGVVALLQFLEVVFPVEGDARRDHIAFFRGLDRGLQQGVETELAVIAQDRRPRIDRAGNGDGVRRSQRHRMNVALEIPGYVGRRRRPAGAVIGCDLALAPRLDQREAIAADAGRLRLDHAEQRAARDRGVRGGAAGTQHLDRRQRGQRMRRRHHRVLGVDRGPAGEMEIPHQWLTLSLFCIGLSGEADLHATFTRGSAMGWLVYQLFPCRSA